MEAGVCMIILLFVAYSVFFVSALAHLFSAAYYSGLVTLFVAVIAMIKEVYLSE
jgi:hypothetical protein